MDNGGNSNTGSNGEALVRSAEVLHEVVPSLLTELGSSGPAPSTYLVDAELSCLRPEIEAHQTETSWTVHTEGRATDLAAAKASVDRAAAFMEAQGWDKVSDKPTGGAAHGAGFAQEDRTLRIQALDGKSGARLELRAGTDCYAHPEDHIMTRAATDPGYGKSNPNYDAEAEKAAQ